MIAANIGRIFLEAYNEKYKATYTPRTFFEEVYLELFFNHPKYLMTAGNSPLENPKISWDKMRKGMIPYETQEKRADRIQKTIDKIENEPADASIAIGYPSLGLMATTSGQLTNLELPLDKDDAYLSWIGSGLGIGVQGGLSFFFTNKHILLDVFEGWEVYRKFLNENAQLRGNQINTWNGQWLAHRYTKLKYRESNKSAGLEECLDEMKDGGMEVKTQSWSFLAFRLAKQYPNSTETVYIYNIGQTNTTIGFIILDLPQIKATDELYVKYFGTENNEQVLSLFGTGIGLRKACQMGAIGVNALEPKGFKDCVTKGTIPKYNDKNEEQIISFNVYKIWLLAMLKNEEMWDKSIQVAQAIHKYEGTAGKARTDKGKEARDLLESTNKVLFFDNLRIIIENSEDKEFWQDFLNDIHSLTGDEYRYYSALIRVQYSVYNKK